MKVKNRRMVIKIGVRVQKTRGGWANVQVNAVNDRTVNRSNFDPKTK